MRPSEVTSTRDTAQRPGRPAGCVHFLRRLSPPGERAAIRDWLVKAGRGTWTAYRVALAEF